MFLLFIIITIILYFIIIKPIFEKFNKVNKYIVYSFWTGKNKMSDSRFKSYEQLKNNFKNQDIEHILVTPDNLDFYIKKTGVNLHKSYQYLSETHKSDYLRCYFMHFIGGGYSDIKSNNSNWISAFNNLQLSNNYASGYKEIGPQGVAEINDKKLFDELCANYHHLIGMCNFIFKPNTPLTQEWYNTLLTILDDKYENLIKYPARHPREGFQDGYDPQYYYPIKWTEILGSILHPLVYKYKDKLAYDCPQFTSGSYR